MLRIHGQMKERPTNENLLDIKDRISVLELDFQHNQDRAWKEIKTWLENKRIVPVGNGMFLAVAVEREEDREQKDEEDIDN